MNEFLLFFDQKKRYFPMHLEISYSKITDYMILVYKQGCAAAFGIHFMLFQTRGYSCVHGIQMIFYGLNTWGFGILAAICGGRK